MTLPLKLLVVEDNPADAELVLHQLHRAGYAPEWERVETEPDYLARLHEGLDLVISDYQLPRFSGLQALKLRNELGLEVPFILVSGTIGEETAVEAMKQGAADYLIKDRLTRLGPAVTHALEESRLRRERRRTELALLESERRFRELLENVELIAMTLDERGRVTFCNDFLLQLTGWSRPEVVGSDWFSRFVVESNSITAEVFATSILGGKISGHIEWPIKTRRGEQREVAWNNTLLRDGAGKICGTASIGLDVTDQKQAGKKIQDQLDELLRWQEVMLNREDRVQALKLEVNELLAQLKSPPRYTNTSPS